MLIGTAAVCNVNRDCNVAQAALSLKPVTHARAQAPALQAESEFAGSGPRWLETPQAAVLVRTATPEAPSSEQSDKIPAFSVVVG